MRQLLVLIVIMSITASCKKSSTSHNSHWTFRDITHYGDGYTLDYDQSLNAVEFNTADKTSVVFLKLPIKSGVYSISSTHTDSLHCTVYASISGNDPYVSTDQAGTVSVTVANGKITAVYNNVSLQSISSSDNGTVSAVIQE